MTERSPGAARLGTPFYVTLQQLVTLPVAISAPVVYACENPACCTAPQPNPVRAPLP